MRRINSRGYAWALQLPHGRACPRPSTTSRHFSNNGWIPHVKLGRGGGAGARDLDQGVFTLCVSLANIVLVPGRGRFASEFVQRIRPVANTSNLNKGVKRRRILPPRHGQKLHLAPDGVPLNWNCGERRQPGSVLWRQDGPKTGRCHLLKMPFLITPVNNFWPRMVGKASLIESACDVASDPFEKYQLMQVLELDNGLPRHRMFPRQDEHVSLLEQPPVVNTFR